MSKFLILVLVGLASSLYGYVLNPEYAFLGNVFWGLMLIAVVLDVVVEYRRGPTGRGKNTKWVGGLMAIVGFLFMNYLFHQASNLLNGLPSNTLNPESYLVVSILGVVPIAAVTYLIPGICLVVAGHRIENRHKAASPATGP